MANTAVIDVHPKLEENKQVVIDLVNKFVKREGTDKLINWLIKADFFTAPASTQYNLAIEGGLCQHSLNRLEILLSRITSGLTIPLLLAVEEDKIEGLQGNITLPDLSLESIIILGLLADINKCGCYGKSVKNVKNAETQRWEPQEYWKWDEQFVYSSRGTKTVFILQQFIKLYIEEAQALAFISAGETIQFSNVLDVTYRGIYESSPLAVYLHTAELEACYVVDKVND